jgi:hypothetical protein
MEAPQKVESEVAKVESNMMGQRRERLPVKTAAWFPEPLQLRTFDYAVCALLQTFPIF